MRRLNEQHLGYGFASHKGCGTPEHAAAIRKMRRLSPAHRRSVRPKVYAEIGLTQAT